MPLLFDAVSAARARCNRQARGGDRHECASSLVVRHEAAAVRDDAPDDAIAGCDREGPELRTLRSRTVPPPLAARPRGPFARARPPMGFAYDKPSARAHGEVSRLEIARSPVSKGAGCTSAGRRGYERASGGRTRAGVEGGVRHHSPIRPWQAGRATAPACHVSPARSRPKPSRSARRSLARPRAEWEKRRPGDGSKQMGNATGAELWRGPRVGGRKSHSAAIRASWTIPYASTPEVFSAPASASARVDVGEAPARGSVTSAPGTDAAASRSRRCATGKDE